MENNYASTYRRIMSSTAIFGGAQALSVFVNIIRAKLVASILHSRGMGMSSVITNAANGLQQLSLLGLNVAAVPDISKAHAEDDERVLSFTVRIVRRLVLTASIIGLIATMALSPLLSQLSFETHGYTRYFMLLSVAVFFNVLGTGELAVMQGMRRYKQLAFCSLVPPLCGLLLSIPIYYIWGIDGIVPAMIVVNAIYFAVVRIMSYRDKRRKEQREHISIRTVWQRGRGIIKFGFVMTMGSLLGTLTTYALTVFITNHGCVEDVGFYQAAGVITTQYIGLLFTAMAADFFPHLSELMKTDQEGAFRLVNQQTEILVLILSPLIMLLILSAPLAIRALLTSEFLATERMVRFLGMAGIFKALCFPMDYIAYAKGDTNYIFWVESVWGCAKTFTIMALFYYFLGLNGLGYGALVTSIVDVIVCLILIPWRYGFRHSMEAIRLTLLMVLLAGACLACSFLDNLFLRYGLMTVISIVGVTISIRQLDRRLNLKAVVNRFYMKWGRRPS